MRFSNLIDFRPVKSRLFKCLPCSLQEVKSQPQNMVLDFVFEEPWTKHFMDVLAPHGYVKIAGERLQVTCFVDLYFFHELFGICIL